MEEITSEIIYWAVLLYVPIYWFIGLIVLGGCLIAGTIWSVLRHAFISPYNSRDVPAYSVLLRLTKVSMMMPVTSEDEIKDELCLR